MQRAFALALVIATVATLARAQSFRVYSNPRFGATAEVPSDWRADPPPENGDGLVFHSPDGQASLTISGILNIADSAEEAMKQEDQAGGDEQVTYRQRGARSLTLSGLQGDRIFYRKSILVCRDQIWNHLSLDYPAARKTDYDALVVRVAKSFHFSGFSAQIPNCR
jgi:serine/threonine-protein kinase